MSVVREPSCGRFYLDAASAEAPGVKSWIMRGANFAVELMIVNAGAVIERLTQTDEYMVLATPGVVGTCEANGETRLFEGDTLLIIPPGASRLTAESAGTIVRIFSDRASDITNAASNAANYLDPPTDVAPLRPWRAPPDGYRLRVYHLPDYSGGSAFGRIFQSSNLMVNIFERQTRRRDVTALSPHSHDDFEQASLTLSGSFVHHLRVPWGPVLSNWRDDRHVEVDSPSLLVIPANLIHTTRDIGEDVTWLVDIFAPPRLDFAKKDGWVRNAADYPAPSQAEAI